MTSSGTRRLRRQHQLRSSSFARMLSSLKRSSRYAPSGGALLDASNTGGRGCPCPVPAVLLLVCVPPPGFGANCARHTVAPRFSHGPQTAGNAGARPAPSDRVDSKNRVLHVLRGLPSTQVLAKHVRCKRGACSTITVSRSVPQEWQTRQGARIVHHAQALIAADILLPTSAAGSPSTSKLFSTPNSVLEQRTQ